MSTKKFDTVVIGGGAAGIVAGISAKRAGRNAVICERMPRPGRKILASGNGRCNLLNERLDESFYNSSARTLVKSVLSRFGKDEIRDFFGAIGLKLYTDESGRVFPVTNQSSSVLKVLELELERLSVPVKSGFNVASIQSGKSGFVVRSDGRDEIEASSIILACGGRSYPAFGSDGAAYKFAAQFGHSIVEPVPVCVPFTAKSALCHILQGQKIRAAVRAIVDGKVAAESAGELLFTKYGLSGTAILDLGDEVSISINRKKRKVCLEADIVPFMDKRELEVYLSSRFASKMKEADITAGILPLKFGVALKDLLKTKDASGIAKALKTLRFDVTGTRGWNEAEFTAGGVNAGEVDESTLESKMRRGLYFAGEMLDVCGRRGGYNLAWAWASGFIAGRAAA